MSMVCLAPLVHGWAVGSWLIHGWFGWLVDVPVDVADVVCNRP
jgi:hypothetical protein